MRHLTPADYRIMPWKNGGGTTTEVAIFPADASASGGSFIWRVSIADVASDGPFSRFPGYDRHIMVIAGKGMNLAAKDGEMIELSQPFVPRQFSGDSEVTGMLIDGPVRDFNLMAARDRIRSSLSAVRIDSARRFASPATVTVIHLLDGEALTAGHVIACGDTLILENESVELSPLGDPATVAVAVIQPAA